MRMDAKVLDDLVNGHSEKLRHWYGLLREIMPDYFFRTFSTRQLEELLPLLFNIETSRGIQRIERDNAVILVYLKSEESNLLMTSRLMRDYNIAGAVIHESEQKLVVDGKSGNLMIEYYLLAEDEPHLGEPAFTLKELTTEYRRRFGKADAALKEAYNRINWNNVRDLSLERLVDRLKWVIEIQDKDHIATGIEKMPNGELRLTVARPTPARTGLYFKLLEALELSGLNVERIYFREVTRQDDLTDFSHKSVTVTTLYLNCEKGISINSKRIQTALREIPLINWVDMDDVFHSELVRKHEWLLADANLIRAAAEFIHAQFSYVDRNAYNIMDIMRLMAVYEPLLAHLRDLFYLRFDPEISRSERKEASLWRRLEKEIVTINSGMLEKDSVVKSIYRGAMEFIRNIEKTNFFCQDKSGLAFRLKPDFIDYFAGISEDYNASFPADRPYGVFYFYRADAIGFQVRFSEIARGGWRTVMPKAGENDLEKRDIYEFAKDEVFREVYVLAHTQHLKNKDIYEGGSKMITLLRPEEAAEGLSALYTVQRAICRAFLSLITYDKRGNLKTGRIIDHLGGREIIEIGPDENMHDVMIEWIGDIADKSGYTLRAGLISGKPDRGINHKEFGVTSFGVHQFLLRTLQELGIDPAVDAFSVKISGGPFGDVAGNELQLLLARKDGKWRYPELKIVAITDGPAALYDPDGIDREELLCLVLKENLDAFSPEKLRGDGARMVFSTSTEIDGVGKHRQVTKTAHGLQEKLISRDEFMELFQNNLYNYADVFIPCGGRPQTIHIANWQKLCPNGKLATRAIVEGANSFITPEARIKLEDAGIMIVKDASANKCGVITSSYEILSGLMLDEAEFAEVKTRLVGEVMNKLRDSSRREAEWLFSQYKLGNCQLTELTEQLSRQINAKNVELAAYLEQHPEMLNDEVILAHLPEVLAEQYADRLDRIPPAYRIAIASVELAARIVYRSSGSLVEEIKSVS
jgi:NAD-specific glutamate dehydrogenase